MSAKRKLKRLNLKLEDGSLRAIKIANVIIEPEDLPGFKPVAGDYDTQLTGLLHWIAKQHKDGKLSGEAMIDAKLALAYKVSEKTGGEAAFAEDTGECLLYVPNEKGHYVVLISKWVDEIHIERKWYDLLLRVELVDGKIMAKLKD